VTTKPGLLDSSEERVALQDSTAGVLLRVPDGIHLTVGQKIRASGAMGTYYGAPQLTATTISSLGQATATVTNVSSAPIGPALEWRLVSVSGTVEDVQRDGESWRAELRLSAGTIPIVGIDRGGIPSVALVEGRSATVVGVVKRAYPTSTDQRLAVVPRSKADITLGGAGSNGSPQPSGSSRPGSSVHPGSSSRPSALGVGTPPSISRSSDGPGQDGGSGSSSHATVTVIAALAEHEGELVRVGGRVVGLDEEGVVTIEDGTGRAAVRLTAGAAAISDQLQSGDLINVTGTVVRTAAGTLEITVDDPANIARVPTPASLAAATDALAMASQAAAALGTDESSTSAATGANGVVLGIAVLLGLIGAALAALAAAGPKRRSKLATAVQTAAVWLRARLQRGRAGALHG
jgi:uncharacterized protein YdeI (BOF family)